MTPTDAHQQFRYELPDFINEKWTAISKEFFLFALNQAEKRLTETTRTSELTTTRAYFLLGACISAVSLLFGYLVTHPINDKNSVYVLASCISIAIFIIVFWKLYEIIIPHEFEVPGSEPRLIFNEGFIIDNTEKEQVKNLYLNECKSYQERINKNHSVNRIRSSHFYFALKLLTVTPLSLPASWLLLEVFEACRHLLV